MAKKELSNWEKLVIQAKMQGKIKPDEYTSQTINPKPDITPQTVKDKKKKK